MISLTFGMFTPVSDSGPDGPFVHVPAMCVKSVNLLLVQCSPVAWSSLAWKGNPSKSFLSLTKTERGNANLNLGRQYT